MYQVQNYHTIKTEKKNATNTRKERTMRELLDYKVVVDTGLVGVDISFDFQAYEGARIDDLYTYARDVLSENLDWHVEDADGNEVPR